MFDAKIVAACIADRQAFEAVVAHVDPDEFTPTGRFWWGQLERWYSGDSGAASVDPEIFVARGCRAAGRNAEAAREWLDALPPSPSPENVARELLLLKREIKYREYCAAMEGERDEDAIVDMIDELHELHHTTDLDTVDLELEAPTDEYSRGDLLPVFPDKLNDILEGGAERGSHLIVFARVEVGKTLFAINNVGQWLRRGLRVMYAGNEEPTRMIEMRIKSNLCQATVGQMEQCPIKARRMAVERGLDNLMMVNLSNHGGGTPDLIDRYLTQYKPDCLVLDQLRNLHSGRRSGTRAQSLDAAAVGVRQALATNNVLGISIAQANAGEHGKAKVWLEDDDVDESRTGIPAQADVLIGIGADSAMKAHNTRAFNLCKNKLTGRHEQFTCRVDPPRSTMK